MSWYANCIDFDAEDLYVNQDFTYAKLDTTRETGFSGFSLPRQSGSQNWGLCETLLARSEACRYQDPEQMILLAERAVAVAEGLDPMEYGRELAADLRARSCAELANAHRVSDDLEGAERMLRRATDWSSRGTQDPLLLARIMRVAAALRGAQRRFPEALALLDGAYTIYERHGDRFNAGGTLISKGLYTGYSNDPEKAIQYLTAGLAMISPARDPKLVLSAVHNLVNFLTDCGRFNEARRILRRSKKAYYATGDRINLIKLRWVEGKIALGLGERAAAETAFRDAQARFAEVGLPYAAALVALDLTALLLEKGETAAARELIGQTVAILRAKRIAREILAALLLLQRSLDADRSSLGVLQTVRTYLKRLESRPAA